MFVPLTDGLCLGVVLFSYAGLLCWGFTCDWDRIPDLHDFVLDIEESFKELQHADGAFTARTKVPAKRAPAVMAKRARATKHRAAERTSARAG